MPTVVIPPPYRGPTQGRDRVQVPGATVRLCLDAIEARHPGFRELVVDGEGRIHRFIKLFRNGDPLRGDVLEARLAEGDELEVLTAIAGG